MFDLSCSGSELYRVHAWRVPCIDTLAAHTLRNRTGNVSRKKAFLQREGHVACYNPSRCVRGVVDGFASASEIAELRTLAKWPYRGAHTHCPRLTMASNSA